MHEKKPTFKRPNPQGTRSKSKIVRVGPMLARIVARIERNGVEMVRVIRTNGEILDTLASTITPAHSMDEANFNAQYQRHLRKVDADKIKHPKK